MIDLVVVVESGMPELVVLVEHLRQFEEQVLADVMTGDQRK